MMVMTAKVDLKKIMLALAAAAALILSLILLLGGGSDTTQTAAPAVSSNDGRVQFLKDFGWDVTTSPVESSQVKIPASGSQVFDRYNALQKNQGYDLTQFAGKNVMRYVYKINNYPNATDPVYATLLVYKNQVIGGDITDTGPKGKIHSFKVSPPSASTTTTTETTVPATTAAATQAAA